MITSSFFNIICYQLFIPYENFALKSLNISPTEMSRFEGSTDSFFVTVKLIYAKHLAGPSDTPESMDHI